MKKYLIVLILLMLISNSISCTKNSSIKEESNETVLAGFESTKELLSMNYMRYFGKSEIETKTDYVTEGKSCAKLTIIGDPTNSFLSPTLPIYTPFMYIFTSSAFLNKKDYSDVKEFKVDFYNAGSKDTKVDFMMDMDSGNEYTKNPLISSFILKKNQMNHIKIPFDRSRLKAMNYNISDVKRFVFIFENRDRQEDQPYVLYMDNFRAVKTTDELTNYSRTPAKDEILFFDDNTDLLKVNSLSFPIEYKAAAKLSINTNLEFVSQGYSSLKIDADKDRKGVFENWLAISILDTYLQTFKLGSLDIEKTSIDFDLYNDSDEIANAVIQIYTKDNVNPYSKATKIYPKSWADENFTKTSLKDLKDTFKSLDEITTFQILFSDKKDGKERVYYIDNLRFTTHN
jgi:hypothetical protein